MASAIASAKLTLSYPLYASDFDPQNSNFLLVGGGGGEGRTGLGNKITLVNTSRKQSISEVVEIDLSQDEDSVTSLAVASSTPSSVIAFAGINSSEKDQAVGKNEHLRSFRLEYPPRRNLDSGSGQDGEAQEYQGQTAPLGRASLFKPSTAPKKETYQRITRLSRPSKINGGQLGAIATGLAPEGEIVLFDAKTNGPMGPWVEARLPLGKGEEAADVDIVELDQAEDMPPGTFSVAYCTDYEVHVCRMTLKQNTQPQSQFAYGEPHPDTFSSVKARPKFRSLRFITPHLLLLLQNRPNRQGADLLLLELSPSNQGRIISRKPLHSGINSATALSITNLAASTPSQSTQHVISVAGLDSSISIQTLEHPLRPPFKSLKLRLHSLLRSVHPLQITSLSFSTFLPPQTPQNSTPPQYIKLASTSIANTVVVHTLPLIPSPPPSKKSPKQRYVLANHGRSDAAQLTLSIIISALAIALGAFLLQAFTEIRGGSPEYLGAKGWLNKRVHDYIALPYMFENGTSTAVASISGLSDHAISTSSSIHEQITNTIVDLKDTVSDSTKAAQETLADSPEKAKEAVSSALDAASAAASELKEASEAYSDTVSQSITSAFSSTTAKTSNQYLHIRDLLSRHHNHRRHVDPSNTDIPHMVIHHDDEDGEKLKAGFHRVGQEGAKEAKRFEELSEKEKEIWKRKLREAGVWAVDEGEAVLKGVFFGGVAQAVGRAVGG
ncbi:MAG: hypothetical protein Q9181_008066 [Wetmoreana brouardii]